MQLSATQSNGPGSRLATINLTQWIGNYTTAGVTWLRPPTTHDYGTVAVFEDLYGNRWDLVQFSDGR